jgi:hypothetical protein
VGKLQRSIPADQPSCVIEQPACAFSDRVVRISGHYAYYGRFALSALYPVLRYVNQTLVAWAMRKFKRFKAHKIRAGWFFERLAKECPDLFAHWKVGMSGVFC